MWKGRKISIRIKCLIITYLSSFRWLIQCLLVRSFRALRRVSLLAFLESFSRRCRALASRTWQHGALLVTTLLRTRNTSNHGKSKKRNTSNSHSQSNRCTPARCWERFSRTTSRSWLTTSSHLRPSTFGTTKSKSIVISTAAFRRFSENTLRTSIENAINHWQKSQHSLEDLKSKMMHFGLSLLINSLRNVCIDTSLSTILSISRMEWLQRTVRPPNS